MLYWRNAAADLTPANGPRRDRRQTDSANDSKGTEAVEERAKSGGLDTRFSPGSIAISGFWCSQSGVNARHQEGNATMSLSAPRSGNTHCGSVSVSQIGPLTSMASLRRPLW